MLTDAGFGDVQISTEVENTREPGGPSSATAPRREAASSTMGIVLRTSPPA